MRRAIPLVLIGAVGAVILVGLDRPSLSLGDVRDALEAAVEPRCRTVGAHEHEGGAEEIRTSVVLTCGAVELRPGEHGPQPANPLVHYGVHQSDSTANRAGPAVGPLYAHGNVRLTVIDLGEKEWEALLRRLPRNEVDD